MTFDMDAELVWIDLLRRHGITKSSPRLVTQGTYGPKVAMPKILNLLDKYNVKAGFFIPGQSAELHPTVVKEVVRRGHEIGHHGYSHTNHGALDYAAEEAEFQKGLNALKSAGGEVPRGFRLPGGDFSDNTIAFIKKFGFLYDSSMKDNDVPYFLEKGARTIVELPVHPELDDWIHYGFNFSTMELQSGVKNPREYLDAITSAFDAIYKEGGYLNLLMHPQLQGRPARISALEQFIRHVRKKKVWIANPLSIAEFWIKHDGNSA
ncbi:MAG: polysaccharide deacetylase [Candidatus Bathyarchaeia archaeon]